MVSATEKATLKAKLETYEGKVNHMYLDSKGYVTVGVGHLIKDLASAQKLNFKKKNGSSASKEEIRTDYESVKKQRKNRVSRYYKNFVELTISDSEINSLTNKHIDSFEVELKIIFPKFSSYPSEVRLALFDIIFNVGMTDLNTKWPNLRKAIKMQDWEFAANESNRKPPISLERNNYVKNLFLKAAKDSKSRRITDEKAKNEVKI
ncbi:hypothetical protein MNF40_004533 [Vibrio parahaemolyticus]|nr:hypothetical protein [Vibrio parahaemolyticus]